MTRFQFVSNPFLVYWKKGVFAVAVIVFVILVVYYLTSSFIYLILSFLVLTMPIVNFLVPSRYSFEENSFVKSQLLQEKRYLYDDFKKIGKGDDGISLMKKNGKTFDYIYIFDENLRADLFNFIKSKLEKYESS